MEFEADPTAPVACTLTTKDAAGQLVEWQDVRAAARSVERLDDGVAIMLPTDLRGGVEDLARREAACCAFLTLQTEVVDGDLRLEITSATAEGRSVIDLMVGAEQP